MADDIVIDKQLFHDRLGNFVTKWKADKRAGDAVFQGATSIATVVGKASEPGSYLKPAAFQVGSNHCAGATTANRGTAVAPGLRIPCDALHPHPRPPPDRHHQEKGYVASTSDTAASKH